MPLQVILDIIHINSMAFSSSSRATQAMLSTCTSKNLESAEKICSHYINLNIQIFCSCFEYPSTFPVLLLKQLRARVAFPSTSSNDNTS